MTIKNILLFIFLLLPSFLSANSEINDIYIGDREPITSPIPEYDPESNSYPNPFNDDQIILTIDKDNYINFVENILTPGQIEMFETYPETFKMHVYPSRRSCAVPPEVLKLTIVKNLSVVSQTGPTKSCTFLFRPLTLLRGTML